MPPKTRGGKDDARGRKEKLPPSQTPLQGVSGLEGLTIATEADVRAMRDKVYGTPITDHEWHNAKSRWMADVGWLIEQVRLDESRKRRV